MLRQPSGSCRAFRPRVTKKKGFPSTVGRLHSVRRHRRYRISQNCIESYAYPANHALIHCKPFGIGLRVSFVEALVQKTSAWDKTSMACGLTCKRHGCNWALTLLLKKRTKKTTLQFFSLLIGLVWFRFVRPMRNCYHKMVVKVKNDEKCLGSFCSWHRWSNPCIFRWAFETRLPA